MKRIIRTTDAPPALGPYSQAVEKKGTLYVSGQIGMDPSTGRLVEGGIREQTTQIFKNIESILKAAGYNFSDVVKSTCFLDDIADFAAMNEIYGQHYTEDQPARSAFAVKALPAGALVEIETIAVK